MFICCCCFFAPEWNVLLCAQFMKVARNLQKGRKKEQKRGATKKEGNCCENWERNWASGCGECGALEHPREELPTTIPPQFPSGKALLALLAAAHCSALQNVHIFICSSFFQLLLLPLLDCSLWRCCRTTNK
jgi:hypothetical protein